jgi:hypothetical protein
MSVVFKGTTSSLEKDVYTDSISTGATRTLTYAGSRTQMVLIGKQLKAQGYSIRLEQDGAKFTLTGEQTNSVLGAENGGTGAPGVPVASESWSWKSERVQADIFSLPSVQVEAAAYAVATSKPIANYRKLIEDATSNGTVYPTELALYPLGFMLYKGLAAGETGFEPNYFALTRKLTYTDQFPKRVLMNAGASLYTRAGFITYFNPPALVQAAMPYAPAVTKANHAWSWRERDYDANYIVGSKIEETTSWVFTEWWLLPYILVA